MSLPKNMPLFGFEIFREIEIELESVKNVFPYSTNNDSYSAVVNLCIDKMRELAEKKRAEIETKIWD